MRHYGIRGRESAHLSGGLQCGFVRPDRFARVPGHDPRVDLMSGPQPGPDWWRGSDGHWYPPQAYPGVPTPGPPKGSEGTGPEKGARSRAFREWIQTGQGIAALVVSIITLAGVGVGAGAAIASGRHPSPDSPGRTPIVITTSPDPGPSPVVTTPRTVTPAQLTRALIPAQALGATATVNTKGTDLSQIMGICGAPLPSGAQATAFELLQDSQASQNLLEIIVDWGTDADAGTAIASNRAAVDKSGSCSYTSGNETTQYEGDYSASPPSSCSNPGNYLDTQVFLTSSSLFSSGLTSGFNVEVQCGSFTIAIQAEGAPGAGVDQGTADGYLSNAAGHFAATVH